jgi:ATPase subunit of ABC transporter with duplicated ATPase domains
MQHRPCTVTAKFGAKTAFASQAKSREKALERMKANLGDIPAAASASGGGDRTKASMRFLPPPPSHREMIVMKDASVGWGGTPLMSAVDLVVEKGQRILVLGCVPARTCVSAAVMFRTRMGR